MSSNNIKAIEEQARKYLLEEGYTVQSFLGSGSFGRVYKAHDFKNNQEVAIKVILPSESTNEDFKKTLQEFTHCQKLNSQYVVKIYNVLFSYNNKLLFIIQEYCSKGNLTTYMKSIQKNEYNLKQTIIQMLRGVIAIHEQNIVHSDLKPDNILINKNGVVKIGDFGEAKQLRTDNGLTHTTPQGCSPIFAAPEVLFQEKGQISKESDYYSIGAVICLLCDLPFQDLQGIQVQKIPNIANNKYKSYIMLALSMMTKEPKKRASCKRILDLLDNLGELNNNKAINQINQVMTECNEEAFSLLNSNLKQSKISSITYSSQPPPTTSNHQPLTCQKVYFIFWVISMIISIVMSGISIYYILKSCFLYLMEAVIAFGFFNFYFSITSFYLEYKKQQKLTLQIIFEILTQIAYITLLVGVFIFLTNSFPCSDLYVCVDKFDVRFSQQQLHVLSDNQLNQICEQSEPQRKEQLGNYFQSKFNKNMKIQYYEESLGILPYTYLGTGGVLGVWLVFRFLINCCSKCCYK